MTVTRKYLEMEIAKLVKERDDFLAEANRHIAGLNGRIHQLELLQEMADEQPVNGQAEEAVID